MSKSLLQTANSNLQNLTANSIIALGSTIRRYGCNCRQNGNTIEIEGCGYYEIDATVTLAPTAAGNVTVAAFKNGVLIPGSSVTGSVTTASNPVTLPIVATVREGCNCEGASQITFVLTDGSAAVSSISTRTKKS